MTAAGAEDPAYVAADLTPYPPTQSVEPSSSGRSRRRASCATLSAILFTPRLCLGKAPGRDPAERGQTKETPGESIPMC